MATFLVVRHQVFVVEVNGLFKGLCEVPFNKGHFQYLMDGGTSMGFEVEHLEH